MAALVARIFLVCLLAVDWAADPAAVAPAVQAWAKRWCCTENVCPSGGYQRTVLRESSTDQHLPAVVRDFANVAALAPALDCPVLVQSPPLHADLVYVLMTLRR